ncbi:MAG TPA: ABC transporter substrate-binding protein [Thermosynechococcaceae cyanobacterium]
MFSCVRSRSLLAVFLILCLTVLPGCQAQKSLSDGVVRLTLWQGVNPPSNRVVLQKLVDQFNQEHPKIQVESLYVGQGDQQLPKILAAIVGNAAPDILWFAPMLTGQLVELDALRPLDDWLAKLPARSQIDPALFSSMEYDGHLWSVPFGTNNVGIYYRPKLFEAAGIQQLPRTWDELRQVSRQLTIDLDRDGRADQHGMLLPLGKGEWTVFTWLPFLWSGGGELGQSGQVQVDSPGAIAALQLWQNLVQDGSAILSAPERGYELDGFLAGKVAMQISGPWTLGQLQATGVDFGVLPIPAGVKRATATGGENLFLFKSSPEREQAALTFLEFALSQSFQAAWAVATGYLPVNLESRRSPEYLAFKSKQPAVGVFLDQAQYGRSRPVFPGYNRISENLGRAIEAALLQQSAPAAALQAAQKRLNLIFNPDA